MTFKLMYSSIYSSFTKCFKLAFLFGILIHAANAQTDDSLQSEIRRALVEEKLTGAVWTVVDADGEIAVDAAGLKNQQTLEPFKPTDKVHIGSVTKTVLAVGVLRLISEEKIGLDDPVGKYLPEIKFDNKWDQTNPVTVRHLLDHTSGLEDLRLWQMFTARAAPDSPLAYAFDKDPSVLRVRTRPGSVFSYSNMGYTLLGMVIEKVANEPYEIYLDANLLRPLKMQNSTFGFVTQIGEKADRDLAMGHLDDQTTFPALPIFLRPAAQFTTTAYDMGLFLKFLMSDGSIDGRPFIKKELLENMGRPENTEAFQKGLRIGYGLGGMKRDRHGVVGFAHSGNIVGYHAMIYAFRESGKAFFISHNMDSESADYERFNEILIRRLNVEKSTEPAKTLNPKELSEWDGYFVPVVSRFEPLAYLDVLTSFTKVTVNDEAVDLSPFQKTSRKLFYAGNGLLTAVGKTERSHVFYKNDENAPIISDGLSSLRKINGSFLLGLWIGFCLGGLGLIYLLVSGAVQLIKFKSRFVKKPVRWAFLAIIMLFVPIPFFFLQSFVSIGDPTFASVLLAISTFLFPLGLAAAGVSYIRNGMPFVYQKADFLAIVFSIQWMLTLAAWGLIPFLLWV